MAEAFGIACHELVSFDFRCGSIAAVDEARFTTYQTVLNGCTPLVPRGLPRGPRQQPGPAPAGTFLVSITPAPGLGDRLPGLRVTWAD